MCRGFDRTISASVLPSRHGGVGKRFAPAAKAAVPVVNLGTAAPGKWVIEHRVPAVPAPARKKSKKEEVVSARWDELRRTKLLLVGYPSTLRIWDTTDLGSVADVEGADFVPGYGRTDGGGCCVAGEGAGGRIGIA
ncbi:hypothetical protein DXG01_003966 [Tephrocybe rancida]|nr:hypothetical protein DXG01_003966 [Tephrocybe rancida]